MGWYFTHGAERRDVIEELTEDTSKDGRVFRTLRKCFRGNTMYALHEGGPADGPKKWIGVYLLQRSDIGWGYKPMDETMGPNYYDCPVSYLDAADEPANDYAKEWREACRKGAAARAAKKPKVGETWSLRGCRIDAVRITSLKPLRGMHRGSVYRIKRDLLDCKVEPVGNNTSVTPVPQA